MALTTSIIERDRGTPQGGVISPLLANLFLHYAFDAWMKREHLDIPFERYADDAICHCRREEQASELQAELAKRFSECGLELHPEKTKIVYCGDSNRREKHPNTQFDFLGYGFRPRCVKSAQGTSLSASVRAISRKAASEIRNTIREQRFYRRTDLEIDDIARWINPMLRGWLEYFGAFHRSALYVAVIRPLEEHIARWAMRKYRWLQGHRRRAREWVANLLRERPLLFSHRRYWAGTVG